MTRIEKLKSIPMKPKKTVRVVYQLLRDVGSSELRERIEREICNAWSLVHDRDVVSRHSQNQPNKSSPEGERERIAFLVEKISCRNKKRNTIAEKKERERVCVC
jgi:hypothetical protein